MGVPIYEKTKYVATKLGISFGALASILAVSSGALGDCILERRATRELTWRLNRMFLLCDMIPQNLQLLSLNILNEPIPGDPDSLTLLHYVLDEDWEESKVITELGKVIELYTE